MIDLRRFEQFTSRLTIRNRDNGRVMPLRFNPSQQKIMRSCIEYQDRYKKMPWVIFLKARRLGISTWAGALGTAHCVAGANKIAGIIAQLQKTADELFSQSRGFQKCLPYRVPAPTKQELYFPHKDGMSYLRKATAKTVIGGRGLTYSFLHLTEAAFYPGEESFVALLNTISANDPDNMVIIETTANGMEGPGEAYYNYWEAAVRGDNGFLPIFLPWYEDPGCQLPADLAKDAPADDYERTLMKDYKVTKAQIAWFRWCLETKCGGSIYKWREEYPSTPEEAFVSSGNPAFDQQEMAFAQRYKGKPLAEGDIDILDGSTPEFREERGGPVKIYEWPEEGCHYFIGVDAAKGVESGDFAAAVGWNGCTGRMAFRFDRKIGPELMGAKSYALGVFFNKAMINVEFTGGWGYIVARELRDTYHYPAQYLWKSRDESLDGKPRKAIGWETTDRSRRMMLDLFRTALRRNEVFPIDEVFIAQMSRAVTDLGWRWTVIHGHDDVFMAGMLGWVAKEQYHVSHQSGRIRRAHTLPGADGSEITPENKPNSLPSWMEDSTSTATGTLTSNGNRHLEKLEQYNQRKIEPNRLEGI